MDVLDRARKYLLSCPEAISGQNGHDAAFTAARAVVWGFDLSDSDAFALLCEWNGRCQPPWTEKELAHKISQSNSTPYSKPRGHLLGNGNGVRAYNSERRSAGVATHLLIPATQPHPVAPKIEVPDTLELPQPLPDATRQLLKACFKPGEGVRIVAARINDEGKEEPENSGPTLTREQWLTKLDAAEGNPNKLWSQSSRAGIYIGLNPLTLGADDDKGVTAFRHALIEFDHLPIEQQWSLYQQTRLPCSAVIHSGGRSLHAWVKVDAKNLEEFRERVDFLHQYFAAHSPDTKNKNPSRLSRLPGCHRFNSQQQLWALNVGDKSWETWRTAIEDAVPTGLPKIVSMPDFLATEIESPRELVCGLMHEGSKIVLGGGSKSHKTWALVDLALSVANGAEWWGNTTRQGRVLYINFEIQDYFFQKRLRLVSQKRGLPPSALLDAWNLRGYSASLDLLLPKLLKDVKPRMYNMIIIDPIYKALGQRDENKAGDIADLLNQIERLTVETKAAVVFGGHFSKGNQASKGSMDRIGGSGVFARDTDTIGTLTAHTEPDCFTVEWTLRNFPPHAPFVVRWEYPLFTVTELNPDDLAEARGRKDSKSKRVYAPLDLLAHVPTTGSIHKSRLLKKANDAGMPVREIGCLLDELLETGRLFVWELETNTGGSKRKEFARIQQPGREL